MTSLTLLYIIKLTSTYCVYKFRIFINYSFICQVLHVNPDKREVIFGYKLPVSRTTSLTWGGPNLDELFVTTSKETDSEDRLSGAIFTIRETGSAGLPPNKFKMENADDYWYVISVITASTEIKKYYY